MGVKLVFGKWWVSLVFSTQFGATYKAYACHKTWRFGSLLRNSCGWQLVIHTWDQKKQEDMIYV